MSRGEDASSKTAGTAAHALHEKAPHEEEETEGQNPLQDEVENEVALLGNDGIGKVHRIQKAYKILGQKARSPVGFGGTRLGYKQSEPRLGGGIRFTGGVHISGEIHGGNFYPGYFTRGNAVLEFRKGNERIRPGNHEIIENDHSGEYREQDCPYRYPGKRGTLATITAVASRKIEKVERVILLVILVVIVVS